MARQARLASRGALPFPISPEQREVVAGARITKAIRRHKVTGFTDIGAWISGYSTRDVRLSQPPRTFHSVAANTCGRFILQPISLNLSSCEIVELLIVKQNSCAKANTKRIGEAKIETISRLFAGTRGVGVCLSPQVPLVCVKTYFCKK